VYASSRPSACLAMWNFASANNSFELMAPPRRARKRELPRAPNARQRPVPPLWQARFTRTVEKTGAAGEPLVKRPDPTLQMRAVVGACRLRLPSRRAVFVALARGGGRATGTFYMAERFPGASPVSGPSLQLTKRAEPP